MLKDIVLYNGKLLNLNNSNIPILNRAFHYGDGIFETIRVFNGKAIFLKNHYLRFTEGLKVLHIDLPVGFSYERFASEIEALIQANEIQKGGRIRVSFFRQSEGYYLPENNKLSYLMECSSLTNNAFVLNENGLQVDIFSDYKKQISKLSRHKTMNAQLYILAALHAKMMNLGDVLLLNEKDIIIETTNANIFIASNRVLYTPPLDDGCVGGTMRMQIINIALQENFKVYETSLRPQNLLVADELFITNSIYGVKWVDAYRQKRYNNELAYFLIEKLNVEAQSA
ncbi:MAG: aminotransferase class IV [Bacteroidota bacterium]